MHFRDTSEVLKIKTSTSSNGPSVKMSLEMLLHIFIIKHVRDAKVTFFTHGVDQERLELEGKLNVFRVK